MEVELNCYKMLGHPHILQYHGHVSTNGGMGLYIYTELCEFGDLGVFMEPQKL